MKYISIMASAGYQQESSHDLLDNILTNALTNRASDIHFDPQRDYLNVRFRIDGLLRHVQSLQKYNQENIISKIKVRANMDITNHRFPQDGHLAFNYQGNLYNNIFSFRVSTFPTRFGESVVLRTLHREDKLLKLEELGLEQDQLTLIQKLITSSSGLILTTGPMGSGKSTLLYSILNSIKTPEKNIVTIENPIELQMSDVRQSQVNEGIGFSFSKAMRSVIRQDPDIIMLGEIRDADTAKITMQAALIGILIFSTFQSFDIPGLVTRLLEMGITNSIVAQSIKGVIFTRLVRTICHSCTEPYQPNEAESKILSGNNAPANFQKGKGCENCLNSGYLGRIGIFEVVYFDNDIESSIIEGEPASYMYELLKGKRIPSMRDAALHKVFMGLTTLDEVIRVLGILPFQT